METPTLDIANCERIAIRQFTSGLANRLRALAGIMALAELYGKPVYLISNPNWACPASFTDVFECDHIRFATEADLNKWGTAGNTVVFKSNYGEFSATAPSMDYFSWCRASCSEEEFRDLVREKARSISLRAPLRAKLASFVGSWPQDVVGVHIRRTDLRVKFEATLANRNPTILERMQELASGQPDRHFLLCADNKESEDWYRERLENRAIIFPKTFVERPDDASRLRDTSVEDAACDLYALAQTRLILGTRHSSFSHYAALLGDTDLELFGLVD